MLNDSDNLRELLCCVPRIDAVSFPNLRRCFSGYGRVILQLNPPLPLPSRLHIWADALGFFAVFFLFFGSLYLARFFVLRSVKTHHVASSKRFINEEAEDSEDDGHWFSEIWPENDNLLVLQGEAVVSLSEKRIDEDTLLMRQGEDDEELSLSPREAFLSEKAIEADPINAFFQVEEKNEEDEGKSCTQDDDEIVAVSAKDEDKGEEEKEEGERDQTGYESSTICSTSKSSANLTENLFSSSSRRHSSKWESYALFRKYEEEMSFLDRLSSQKLTNADSWGTVRSRESSMTKRIARTLTAKEKNPSSFKLAHQELEVTYVSQICLTWEALRWSYKLFRQASARDQGGSGGHFSARTAQKFQQFQVLLQRFVENEPFEKGPRPEIYARTRISAPKLLQVPELHDTEDRSGKMEEESRVSGAEFRGILDECISTFMGFLKNDRESHWRVFREIMRRRLSCGEGETLVHVLVKANERKKRQLKDLGRGSCPLRKKRRWKRREDEMEALMGLVDLKIVSRVLRMRNLSEEQLQWCEEKMSKVKVCDGQMRQDSTPLFFPCELNIRAPIFLKRHR